MNLYTICEKKESIIDLKSKYGIKFENYSMSDYDKFIEVAKKYYVSRIFSWYDTDMSDSDSGTIYDYYPINYTNLIIKDNELYGVLVKTRNFTPDYFLLDFENKHIKAALGGGYTDLDYEWLIKDKDLENLDTLNVSSSYVLLYEKIAYKGNKLYSYEREIIGFLQEDCIIKDNCIIGLKYTNNNLYEFIFSKEDSMIKKLISKNGEYKNIINMKLVEIDQKFLDSNIINVTYQDFKKGNFKLLNL